MERIKNLNLYQKIILAVLAVMFVVFTITYFTVSSRVGYDYKGAILLPQEENGSITYTGRVRGEDTVITVTADNTVTFRYEQKVYGPYTVKEDPTAVPEGLEISQAVTGVQILQGEDVFFRGGVLETGGYNDPELALFHEDGSFNGIEFSYAGEDGIERDSEGNPIDQRAPSAKTILELMGYPKLTNKGDWELWWLGVFVTGLTVVLMLFADELFRWNLRFQIRDPERAEPSDFEMAGRYIGWTVLTILALVCYIIGLNVVG